jgi:heavy metal sensor kinase
MTTLSIRMRLSAWYLVVLCLSLAILTGSIFWAAQRNVSKLIDGDLRARLKATQAFMEQQITGDTSKDVKDLQDEFEEFSASQPGGELLQISDASGRWIFQSPSIQRFNIRPGPWNPNAKSSIDALGTLGLLRIITGTVTIKGNLYNVQLATDVSKFHLFLEQLKWLLLISTPLAIALALAGGYWLSGRALQPVRQITEQARLIGAEELSLRLDVPPAADEMRLLTETLNEMLGRIESSFKKITQFTADASHELRTPVAIIRTTAEVALRHRRDEKEYRQSLLDILEEAKRTSSLLDDLLALTRSDSGVWQFAKKPANIAEIVQSAHSKAQLLAAEKDISFSLHKETKDAYIEGDEEALSRMFLVLFDNAIKYTPSGGHVVSSFSVRDGSPVLEIRDSGIGIPKNALAHIFERFFQVDASRTRDGGGVGLGLAIAKAIASAHRADIQVESQEGQGSVFTIRFTCLRQSEQEIQSK